MTTHHGPTPESNRKTFTPALRGGDIVRHVDNTVETVVLSVYGTRALVEANGGVAIRAEQLVLLRRPVRVGDVIRTGGLGPFRATVIEIRHGNSWPLFIEAIDGHNKGSTYWWGLDGGITHDDGTPIDPPTAPRTARTPVPYEVLRSKADRSQCWSVGPHGDVLPSPLSEWMHEDGAEIVAPMPATRCEHHRLALGASCPTCGERPDRYGHYSPGVPPGAAPASARDAIVDIKVKLDDRGAVTGVDVLRADVDTISGPGPKPDFAAAIRRGLEAHANSMGGQSTRCAVCHGPHDTNATHRCVPYAEQLARSFFDTDPEVLAIVREKADAKLVPVRGSSRSMQYEGRAHEVTWSVEQTDTKSEERMRRALDVAWKRDEAGRRSFWTKRVKEALGKLGGGR